MKNGLLYGYRPSDFYAVACVLTHGKNIALASSAVAGN